jgi:TonB-linked SusC/RagA family outer membrane protein
MKKIALLMLGILIVGIQVVSAQVRTVTGTVTSSEDGTAIPGVSVVVKGTTIGTVTNIDGYYSLDVPNDAQSLEFSFVGMKSTSMPISGSTINVTLDPDILGLEEVMVVAYGTTTKEAFTGSAEVIGAQELESRAITSAVSAIEGSTTGVQVLNSTGEPGASPSIIIRGVGTLNGSTTPLYIVDGVQYEGSLANINPEDIESMTILKDAASTALYGSRAANGVVMITTKSGKKGAGIVVNVTAQAGVVDMAVPFYDATTPGEYYELMWEALRNTSAGGGDPAYATENIYNQLGYNPFNVPNNQIVGTDGKLNPSAQMIYQGMDWYDALTQQGYRQNYSVNVSGGDEKYDVYFSTAYLDEQGYVITSAYDRLSSRLNANFRPKAWLALGANMSVTMTNSEGPDSGGSSSIVNPFGFAKNMGSVYSVYIVDPATGNFILDAAGEKQYDFGGGYSELGISPRPNNPGRHAIAEALWNKLETKVNNIDARYTADFIILPELKVSLNYGLSVNDYFNKEYENERVGDGAPQGRYRETRFRRTVKNFTQLVTYNKRFDSGHNFDVTLGHENFDRHYTEVFGMKNTQTAVGIHEFDNFATTSSLDGYSSDKRTEGFFARFNYNYADKYYISASARRDGSSVFSKDVRWGNFYSVGASWRIDQEDFMQDVVFVDNLKLRASFGQVGQDNLGDFYISQPRYSLFPNAGDPGIFWSDLGNELLTWETTESWDVALDFALFNNLLEGSLEYYQKISSDLLYNVPLPLSVGLNTQPDNVATLVNSGFEIGLTAHLVQNNNFKWDLSVNASTMKNEITDLPDPFVNGSKRWEIGRSRYDFFVYDFAGVDPDNGDALYYAYEEEPDPDTGEILRKKNDDGSFVKTNDYQDAGKGYADKSSLPDVIGSIQNNFGFYGFDFGFMFTYQLGGYILDYGYSDMMHPGNYGASLHPDQLDGWRKPGDITDIPRMESGDPNLNVGMSTRYLTDASYLALKNVSLSYNFNQPIIKDFGIDNLRVFLIGENLFINTARKGLNPQYNLAGTPSGNDYNPSRSISLGVNVTF